MPQEFMILKCFSCSMFQVHQVRKTKIWNCKMCNEKQSQQKLYGKGTGKECRNMVQQLNMKKIHSEGAKLQSEGISCQNAGVKTDSSSPVASKWHVFRVSSNIPEDTYCKSDDDDKFDRQMTPYDVRNIITSSTLDAEEWSGNKRRLKRSMTKQKKHDNDFVVDQKKIPHRTQNVDRYFNPTKVPNFSSIQKCVPSKRNFQSTTIPVAVEKAGESLPSKWSKFGSNTSYKSSDYSSDED